MASRTRGSLREGCRNNEQDGRDVERQKGVAKAMRTWMFGFIEEAELPLQGSLPRALGLGHGMIVDDTDG